MAYAPYKSPEEASKALTAAFSPTTDVQRTAIKTAADLVPTRYTPESAPGGTFDQQGNYTPPASKPTEPVTARTPGGVPYANTQFATGGAFDPTPVTAESEATIRETARKQVQAQIDAINELAQVELAGARQRGTERLGQTRAIGAATGMIGSPMGEAQAEKTRGVNTAEERAIQAASAEKIGNILAGVNTRADSLVQAAKSTSRENATAYMGFLKDQATQARADFTALATSGAELSGEQKQKLIDQTGYDPATFDQLYKSMKIANSTDIINKDKPQIVGNKAIFFKQTKNADGTVGISQEVLDLPEDPNKEIKTTVARDDGVYVFYTDGTWAKVGEPDATAALDAEGKRLDNAQKRAELDGGDGTGGSVGISARDAESIMAGTLNLSDTSTKNNYRGKVAAELRDRQKKALESGDIVGVMRSSAAFDKEPGDTFLTSMEKTTAVLSQIGVLQESIGGEKTGPIVGAFRAANPWDTKAQVIKAELNAIVPNLARGVYGEVGVLTDNDIKQYSKTLPTLTSTEAIRNAILYITVDQIRKNVEIKIKNQAAGQRDMSGYADVYQELKKQADDILATIPGAASGGNTTLMTGPDGVDYNVPNDNIDAFIAAGGKKK